MWKCPNCNNLLHTNPETHWKHLRESPACYAKTFAQDLAGWQGMEMDGIPQVAPGKKPLDPKYWVK